MAERIQKIIADSGLCSRRAAEKLITDGKVTVNGVKAELGARAESGDLILVDGEKLPAPSSGKEYIMLNKPRGYVTTMSDEKGRHMVSELVSDVGTRVYPVGRLDMYSEGLLILTNDGDFANKLMHPSHMVTKLYRVTVSGEELPGAAERLSRPMTIDGYRIKPAEVSTVRINGDEAELLIGIHEGRNRQIRKMCAQCGLKVIRLCRIREGSLELGELRPGKWRRLTQAELRALME